MGKVGTVGIGEKKRLLLEKPLGVILFLRISISYLKSRKGEHACFMETFEKSS